MEPGSTTLTAELLPTRYSLLSRLQNWEDQESWQAFFDTYWRLIYSVALKSGLTQTEAEEVVQETIICVAKHIQKFERDPQRGSFKGWLCHLTRWRIADQLRKRTGLLQGENGEAVRKYQSLESVRELADESGAVDWEKEWQVNLLQAAECYDQARSIESEWSDAIVMGYKLVIVRAGTLKSD